MISLDDFYRAYQTFRPLPDPEQKDALEETPGQPLFIVAGPGTGKTACLTLRILKLVLVDDIPPRSILATTFTKKAAAELRSRVLGWGFRLMETLAVDPQVPQATRDRLARIDINQVVTGTLDSLCEQVLRDYRDPGTQPPILADDYVAKTLLLRCGLLDSGRYQDADLDAFLLNLRGGLRWGWNIGAKNDLIQGIWDRRFQDQVDWPAFLAGGPDSERRGRQVLGDVIDAYKAALADRSMVDFALIEQEVLNRLRSGQLKGFVEQVRVILVDEYQDTNLLQESIYFELVRACQGVLTVVGDEDQALYRFRGATVELFSEFASRYETIIGQRPRLVFLQTNYRSTQQVVELVDAYARLDREYQSVRVQAKPPLRAASTAPTGQPILGLFRDDVETLAADLAATFLEQVFRRSGYMLPDGTVIRSSTQGGDLGDCALLCSSPAEYNSERKPRLPRHLRDELLGCPSVMEVFNPRGEDLTSIDVIQRFGGLLLECLDPRGVVEGRTSGLSRDIRDVFAVWRTRAIEYVASGARPGLLDFALGWAGRNPRRAGWTWPPSVPVLELVYGLTFYFPELYDDPEGQVYLEVFTRQISACEQVGSFKGRVVYDQGAVPDAKGVTLPDRSLMELLRDFLAPIASGAIKVNEDLMDAFPRDRLSILSIHQAKGLEFPLTIVDVGSDFRSNHAGHAFKRFPRDGGVPQALEDLLRPYSALARPNRSSRDRAFDDLYRQFFVAFSRPQEILVLVGLTAALPGGSISNVATGWTRAQTCSWINPRPFLTL